MDEPRRSMNVGENERILSILGGIVLLLYFFARRSLGGLLSMLLGGYLLYRGFTGHDEIKEIVQWREFRRQDTRRVRMEQEEEPEAPWYKRKDVVQEASEESFPASDAPAWTSG